MARRFPLVVLMLLLSSRANADAPAPVDVAVFSRASNASGLPPGWQAFSPAPKVKPTHFALERDAGRMLVRADADQSMSKPDTRVARRSRQDAAVAMARFRDGGGGHEHPG